MLLYDLLWTFFGGALAVASQFFDNYRLKDRLALEVPLTSPGPASIWIHALSVGEVKSAFPLVRRIKARYPTKRVVLSASTKQGLELARKEFQGVVDLILTMPLDFWWSQERVIHYVNPEVFLLVETDLWPGLLRRLHRKGIPNVLLNGRISDKTFLYYRKSGPFARLLFKDLSMCFMQTDRDSERLMAIGVAKDKVVTAGNIKFDYPIPSMDQEEKERWRRLLGISNKSTVWIAGSTHGQESYMILEIFAQLQRDYQGLVLILAPRKLDEVVGLIEAARSMGIRCARRSELPGDAKGRPEVVILDTIGELGRIYGLGDIAFVGGTLIPFGGHNLIEPAGFAIPVLFGPHTTNFAWMAEALSHSGGGIRVKDAGELKESVSKLLESQALRREVGRAALCFVKENEGALDRILNYIDTILKRKEGPEPCRITGHMI